jgi:mono/diheme cytochrome c family protein
MSGSYFATAAIAAALLAGASPAAYAAQPTTAHGATPSPASDKVARGQYLVTISGCHDCHTPFKAGPAGPEPDMTRMLSGHPEAMALPPPPKPEGPWIVAVAATNTAWAGPWGVSFPANLTPDPDTGLGKWTLRHFTDTMRTGRRMGRGRQLLPPMPIPMYKHMTDQDLEAVFAYLQSIPAIRNAVPEPLPPQGK